MSDDFAYQGHLDVWWIGNGDFLASFGGVEGYGFVCEDGEANLAFFSNEFDAVGTCAFVSDKAPTAATWHSVVECEGCAYCVFALV